MKTIHIYDEKDFCEAFYRMFVRTFGSRVAKFLEKLNEALEELDRLNIKSVDADLNDEEIRRAYDMLVALLGERIVYLLGLLGIKLAEMRENEG